MALIEKQYLKEIYKGLGYFATWSPGVTLKLGDIGVMDGNKFERESSLKEKGIEFEVREDDTPMNLQYSSAGNVVISLKAAGNLPPVAGCTLTKADAGAIIEFKNTSGVVFKANKILNPCIEDTHTLGKEIMRRYERREWEKEWKVITELAQAGSATIIISQGKGGKIELKAEGQINAANIDIADTDAKFHATHIENIHTQIIAKKGITPLFKVKGIKKKWIFLGSHVFKTIQSTTTHSIRDRPKLVEVPVFGDIDFEL